MDRMNGTTWWIDSASAPVLDAIITDERIAFDVTCDDYAYTVVLVPAPAGPPWWKATWTCKTDGSRGSAAARMYKSSDQGIVLAGHWKEDGEHTWITELRR